MSISQHPRKRPPGFVLVKLLLAEARLLNRNIRENNRRVASDEYRQEVAGAGGMMVNSVNDIVDLDWALG